MSADIFRTNQLIIIMLNQKHSYLTFNKRGKQEMSLEFEPLLPCNKKTANSRQAICGFLIIASQISYYSRLSLKTLSYTNSYSSFPIL